jgi:hypothetical protein
MDHVPYPPNPAVPLTKVPYICSDFDEYDGLGFIDYPVRRGWSSAIGSTDWMDCTGIVAARRAQSWLCFGLLQEILGKGYEQAEFLLYDAEVACYWVNTSKLPDLVLKWSQAVRHRRKTFTRSITGSTEELCE